MEQGVPTLVTKFGRGGACDSPQKVYSEKTRGGLFSSTNLPGNMVTNVVKKKKMWSLLHFQILIPYTRIGLYPSALVNYLLRFSLILNFYYFFISEASYLLLKNQS